MTAASSAITNHLEDQGPSVLHARARLRLALPHVRADEEQAALPELGQGQGVVEVGDAAGTWKILETAEKRGMKQDEDT